MTKSEIKGIVSLYKDNGRNASITGSLVGLSRERIRQILVMAEEQGLMTISKRTPFDTERWFPTILRIIKYGGDIFDIVEDTRLSPQRIAWCLKMMKEHRLITKRQHKSVAMSLERMRLTHYLKEDNLSSKIIHKLYRDRRIWQANTLYYNLIGETEVDNPVINYYTFYNVLSRLHSCGVLYRPQRGFYKIHPDFVPLLEKYFKMKQKGDLRVSKNM